MPGRSQSTVSAGVQGTIHGITVDLSALPYFLHPFPGPYRAGVPSRLVPVGSDCVSRRRVVSRGSVHPRSETRVGVGSGVLARPSGRRDGLESEAGAVSPRPGLPVGDWIALLAYRLGTWAGPRVARLVRNVVCWAEPFAGKLVQEGPWVYEPDRSTQAPGRFG